MENLPTAARLLRVQSILVMSPDFADSAKICDISVRKQRTGDVVQVSTLATKTAIVIANDGKEACTIPKKEILEYASKAAMLTGTVDELATKVKDPDPSADETDAQGNDETVDIVQSETPGTANSSRRFTTGIYALLICVQKLEQAETDPERSTREEALNKLLSFYKENRFI